VLYKADPRFPNGVIIKAFVRILVGFLVREKGHGMLIAVVTVILRHRESRIMKIGAQ
jgi:hypothetical protein